MPKSCIISGSPEIQESRNPGNFLQDIHGMTSPCCKDAHGGFHGQQIVSAPGLCSPLECRGTECQQHPGMPSPFPQHSGEHRNISRCFSRRDFLGRSCQSALGGCEHGRVTTDSVQDEREITVHRFMESLNILRWKDHGSPAQNNSKNPTMEPSKASQQQRGHSREDAACGFGSIFSLSLSISGSGSPLHMAESTHKEDSGWDTPGGCFYPTPQCCHPEMPQTDPT